MLKYKIEMVMVKALINTLGLFPLSWRFKYGEFLGILIYYAIKKRREITYKNLKIAFPEKSMSELKKIAKESYKSTAKNVLIPFYMEELIEKNWIEYENKELIDKLLQKDRGLIILTMHMAGFEAGFSIGKDYKTNVVFKKQKNPYLNDMMTKCREKTGAKTILKNLENGSNDKIIEVFKNKEILVLASDQYSEDVEIKFFGRDTWANTGVILLGMKYKCPILFAYSTYGKNKIKLHFVDELEIEKVGSLKESLKYNTQNLFSRYEEIIKKYPEQYMWQHNRWRK